MTCPRSWKSETAGSRRAKGREDQRILRPGQLDELGRGGSHRDQPYPPAALNGAHRRGDGRAANEPGPDRHLLCVLIFCVYTVQRTAAELGLGRTGALWLG